MSEYTTVSFFDPGVWHGIMLVGLLFISLLVANILKARIPVLGRMLIPNAVLGGIIVLIISTVCYFTTGSYLFNLPIFSDNNAGMPTLEILTYHCLAIGFIAMTLRPSTQNKDKKRSVEIVNTGIATIGTYMIQAIFGILITLIASRFMKDLVPGSGVLMCFGYGQGTGQALNIGKNFDTAIGGATYANMGLALAALGFLSACFVGVPYLNFLRKKGLIDPVKEASAKSVSLEEIQSPNEVPMNESVDKLSMQVALICVAYLLAYGIMVLLSKLIPGMAGTIYGFNFLFGVIAAVIVKAVINFFKKKGWLHREYTNTFLLNRISGFAFDLMIVSGVCAIQIHTISAYLGLILLLGAVGAALTYFYQRFVTKKLFPAYEHEQFLAFFGMLTGTASTGMILLREADPDLKSPVSENLVYQNLPAIVLGFPLLLIASSLTNNAMSISNTILMLGLIIAFFAVLNVALFRSFLFKKKKK